MEGVKILKQEICKESNFSIFLSFFLERESWWSTVCFFSLQAGRRGKAEEAGNGGFLGAWEQESGR